MRAAWVLQRATGDLDAYLETLNMTITFQPFDQVGRHVSRNSSTNPTSSI